MTTIQVETDTKLAKASQDLAVAKHRIAECVNTIHRLVGDTRPERYQGSRKVYGPWGLTDEQALAPLQTAAKSWDQGSLETTRERLAGYRQAAAAAADIVEACNAIYWAEGGWSRFFLVDGGHIHSSMNCSTCNNGAAMTQFSWLPGLSGLSEKEAVAEHGAILCTVCYPSAPVEWTNGRELEAAAKAAARCPGSGQSYDPGEPHEIRRNYKWGRCPGCGENQTLTPNLMIRAHKSK